MPGAAVATVETNILELEQSVCVVHAMSVDSNNDAEIARGQLAFSLLLEAGARHVEGFDTLDVDVVLVELNAVPDVEVVATGVTRVEDDEGSPVVGEGLCRAVWEVNENVVARCK